ncbi:PRC-barrel domain-containing protein [Leptolyngbya iicbica]|uniref:Photosystem reaction center subunit H n=2 Tax=Cyanophyceae TaxID=3028117 RepID=A0A4Q7E178_9CYAN|nr:hypothetical protein [Leptolyngbya sp. LK]RZM75015.1 hypothetical protein DYY88_22110 [Leptolyngbya sp. LK]
MADGEPTQVRQSQLHQQLVIDLETTEELGKLSQFLVDVQHHQVEGFVCKKGLLSFDPVPIMWVQVDSVGQDCILVRRSGATISERLDAAIALDHQAIWSDAGSEVGQLVDYCIDLATGEITQYLFTAPGWQGLTDGVYTFAPTAVVSVGKKRMMVQQAALQQAEQFVPGVQDRVQQAWQQDLNRTRQDMQGAIDSTREVAEQVQNQAQKLTEQARSQFGQVFGQVKKRSKGWRSQVNDRFADAASNFDQGRRPSPPQVPGDTIDVDSEEIWPEENDSSHQP